MPRDWRDDLISAGSSAGSSLASAFFSPPQTSLRARRSKKQEQAATLADEAAMRAEASRVTRDDADWSKAEGAANDLERMVYGQNANLSLTQVDDALDTMDLTSAQREMARQMFGERAKQQSAQSQGLMQRRSDAIEVVARNIAATKPPSQWGQALGDSELSPQEREQAGQIMLQLAADQGLSSEPAEAPARPQMGPGMEQYLGTPEGQQRLYSVNDTMQRMRDQRAAAKAEFERRMADQADLRARTFAPSGPYRPQQPMTVQPSGPPQAALAQPSGGALPPEVAAQLEMRRKQRMATYEQIASMYSGGVR